MSDSKRFHAALRDPDRAARDLDCVTALVRRTLIDQGIALTGDDGRPGLIQADGLRLTLRPDPAPSGTPRRLVLTLAADGTQADPYLGPDLVLIIAMYRLTQAFNPTWVEWLDPQAVIPADAFLQAFDGVQSEDCAQAARSRRKVSAFPKVDDPAPQLHPEADTDTPDRTIAARLRRDSFAIPPTRAEKARNDIQRLTSWAITGCVASLSLPVAVSLAAVNLAKGEDFRLNTQVLSLTALVGTVSGFGIY